MRAILLIVCLSLGLAAHAADSSVANFICDPVTNADDHAQCIERAKVVTRNDGVKISEGFYWYSVIWPYGWWLLYYGFAFFIGRFIYRDAKAREWLFLGVRPVWWALVAFFEPAIGLLAYWAVHYSKLAQTYHEATAPPPASVPDA